MTRSVGVQVDTKDQECQTESAITDVDMKITTMRFIAFSTEVVNCAAQAKRRSEKINIISSAAIKHLGWEGVSNMETNKIFSKSGNNTCQMDPLRCQDSSVD